MTWAFGSGIAAVLPGTYPSGPGDPDNLSINCKRLAVSGGSVTVPVGGGRPRRFRVADGTAAR